MRGGEQLISLIDEMIGKLEANSCGKARVGPIAIYIENSRNVMIDQCTIEGYPIGILAEGTNGLSVTRTSITFSQDKLESSIRFLREIKAELEKKTPDRTKLGNLIEYFKDKAAPEILKGVISGLVHFGLYCGLR
jgi:hypothetical protein